MNFVPGNERASWQEEKYQHQKALAVLLVCMGLSYRASGFMVDVVRNTIYQWFKRFAKKIELPVPERSLDVVEMDEISPKGTLRNGISFKKRRKVVDLESHNDCC